MRLFDDIGARLTKLENLSAIQTLLGAASAVSDPKAGEFVTLPASGDERPADVERRVVDEKRLLDSGHRGREWPAVGYIGLVRAAAIAVYSERSEARGIRAWREADVSGAARYPYIGQGLPGSTFD